MLISHDYNIRLLWCSYITVSYINLFALIKTISYSSVPYVLPEDCIQTHTCRYLGSPQTQVGKSRVSNVADECDQQVSQWWH